MGDCLKAYNTKFHELIDAWHQSLVPLTMQSLLILGITFALALAKPGPPIASSDPGTSVTSPNDPISKSTFPPPSNASSPSPTPLPLFMMSALAKANGNESPPSYEDFNFDPSFSEFSPEYDSPAYINIPPFTPLRVKKNPRPKVKTGTTNKRHKQKEGSEGEKGPEEGDKVPTTITRHVHSHKGGASGDKQESWDEDIVDGVDWMDSKSIHFHKHIHKDINKTFDWNHWHQQLPVNLGNNAPGAGSHAPPSLGNHTWNFDKWPHHQWQLPSLPTHKPSGKEKTVTADPFNFSSWIGKKDTGGEEGNPVPI